MEYITFDREAPERSFGKIIEMLNALSPKAASGAAADGNVAAPSTEPEKVAAVDHWSNPQPDWDRRRYELALHFKAFVDEDANSMERLSQAYLATADAKVEDNRDSWTAYVEYTKLSAGKGGSLPALEELARDHPRSSRVLEQLASAYQHYEDFEKSSRTFEAASREASSMEEMIRLPGRAALDYQTAGQSEKVLQVASKMRVLVKKGDNGERALLTALKNLAELRKDENPALAIMERIIECEPDNIDTRFSLAYAYSKRGSNDLALFHYLRIPHQERNSMTWNNLGVTYDRFEMPVRSVRAYQKSKGMGESLAMTNLAHKFVSAGFLNEADKECEEALKVSYPHKNIGHTLAKIKETPDKEGKTEEEVVGRAKPKSGNCSPPPPRDQA